jgi:hypothetical protein
LVYEPIAAHFKRAAIGAAPVAGHRVAVIADLSLHDVHDAVAAGLTRAAITAASIASEDVAVIAGFANLDDAIAASTGDARPLVG